MLNRLYQNGKTAARALGFVVTALLALALAVGANSGILSLSEFTHARGSIFSAESAPAAGSNYELIRDARPEALPGSNRQQGQGEQTERIKDCAAEGFDLRLGETLFNRRVWTGKF